MAGFLQLVHDHFEMWDDYEPGFRIRTTFELDQEIKRLKDLGWLAFGARARGKLRGGKSRGDSDWETAYLRLVRADSPDILRFDIADSRDANEASSEATSSEPETSSPELSARPGGRRHPDEES